MRSSILVLVLFFVTASLSYSQPAFLKKGTIQLGGTAGYSQQKGELDAFSSSDDNTQTLITMNPTILYSVGYRIAFGGGLMSSREKVIYKSEYHKDEITNTNTGIGPRLEWYFMPAKRSTTFIGAAVFFLSTETHVEWENSYEEGSHKVQSSGTQVEASIGYIFALNAYVGIVGELYHAWIDNEWEVNNSLGEFDAIIHRTWFAIWLQAVSQSRF